MANHRAIKTALINQFGKKIVSLNTVQLGLF